MGVVSAIILCPGASLISALRGLRTGSIAAPVLLGVNRAVVAWPCDYWCSLDAKSYNRIEPLGSPEYIIRWDQAPRLKPGSIRDLGCAKIIRKRLDGYPRGVDYYSYSLLSAIAFLAIDREMSNIDIYGADMVGIVDWDGTKNDKPNRRARDRWRREYAKLQVLCDYFDAQGVNVNRCFLEDK